LHGPKALLDRGGSRAQIAHLGVLFLGDGHTLRISGVQPRVPVPDFPVEALHHPDGRVAAGRHNAGRSCATDAV
ncbi:hypothetical protein RZS08_64685, partial [Arthrospira platensis SPKY1]|nr:hypothetical protein [Arthrospira platensis SPKY1]